jgi:hypothetical protein
MVTSVAPLQPSVCELRVWSNSELPGRWKGLGIGLVSLNGHPDGLTRRYLGAHEFDRVCNENGIVDKLTKPYHFWTNGQAERMEPDREGGDYQGISLSRP